MPPQIIEQWISAGLLYPEEVRAAEKLMRTMRNKGGERRKASS
jgi:hypothetical protein